MSDSYNQDPITRVDRSNTDVDRQEGAGYAVSNTADQFDGGANNAGRTTNMQGAEGGFNDYGVTEIGRGESGGVNNTADQFDGSPNNAGRTTHMEKAEGGFNDYGVTELGRDGPTSGNQDNNFGTARTGGMDHNSGPGNSGGGFDAGRGAETARTSYGTNRGNFGTSGGAMDHNSVPENAGGGLDVGSGAGAGMGKTGGAFRTTSGMDHNSRSGNTGGGFDMGSGAGAGGVGTGIGMGANTTSSANEYGSENRNQYGAGTSSNEYGTSATSHSNHGGKPTMGDRIKGGAEKVVGQITKNPELVEKGQLRKEGEFSARSDDFTSF